MANLNMMPAVRISYLKGWGAIFTDEEIKGEFAADRQEIDSCHDWIKLAKILLRENTV